MDFNPLRELRDLKNLNSLRIDLSTNNRIENYKC